ncbi:MAG: amidase [Stappiaceae bacterium]
MTDVTVLAGKSALMIGSVLAEGSVSPVDLTKHLLDRIDHQTSPIFVNVTRERAMQEAQASEVRLKSGHARTPLDGVPIGWKDLIDMKGEITTAGSDFYRNAPHADCDAPIVANATAAGMVNLGKLNLTEFAYSGLGLNPHFGTPVNPHDTNTPRAPGGSSSGSAVAVAAGLCPCAIGTDTGGSVRIPAAFNGLVGYKSSEGRIDGTGVFALSRTLDTVGPLARSVADCAALDAVLRGKTVGSITPIPMQDTAFFVPDGIVLDDLEDAVAENFEASIRALEAAGATITHGTVPALERSAQVAAQMGTITAAEAYREHQALVDTASVERIDRRVVARIMIGKAMSSADLEMLRQERERCMHDVRETLAGAFLLMPTAAHVAPVIAPLEADDEIFHTTNLKTLRNTALGNFLNLPGLAIPNGTGVSSMPTSLLVSSTGGDDDRLLAAGLEIEKALRTAC